VLTIKMLQNAADRCDDMLTSHSVLCGWEFDTMGMKFTAQSGRDKCSRHVDWSELEQSKVPETLLLEAERQALRGISS
jgi:hypothetical protein